MMNINVGVVMTNEDLKVGDKVYPLVSGKVTGDKFEMHQIDKPAAHTNGFPDDPHTILDLHHSDYKPYEVRTDKGFGPRETYFKIRRKP